MPVNTAKVMTVTKVQNIAYVLTARAPEDPLTAEKHLRAVARMGELIREEWDDPRWGTVPPATTVRRRPPRPPLNHEDLRLAVETLVLTLSMLIIVGGMAWWLPR